MLKILPNTKYTSKTLPKDIQNQPKWRSFAKSGHLGWKIPRAQFGSQQRGDLKVRERERQCALGRSGLESKKWCPINNQKILTGEVSLYS